MPPSSAGSLATDPLFASLSKTKRSVVFRRQEPIFSVGDRSDSIFFIESGNAKLTLNSPQGKEAVVAILDVGDFCGEEALDVNRPRRSTNAIALTQLRATKIERDAMLRLFSNDSRASVRFISSLIGLVTHLRTDLADHLLYGSEQRLARTLLAIAHVEHGDPYRRLPNLNQQELANMIGLTRQRVNVLMQRFKKLGFIDNSHGLRVHSSIRKIIGKYEPDIPRRRARTDG